ncbi:radical SAM protein [Methanocella sp. CWC-04]|uniref:Radical SAM protein n=1 Tax=Methanooceanicella nereidis TaxID=2052831 RepID=A0AAP2W5D8_9EURY|nr:radical SAM protein [Methanocella sp. CWC-04]MCD1294208.1 radical SAM protein [Methanocella sp. CWC-04]
MDNNGNGNYIDLINDLIKGIFNDAIRASFKDPGMAAFFLKTMLWQKKAASVRQENEESGMHVPPVMILSVTDRCNLHCAGCYAQNLPRAKEPEMSEEKLRSMLKEAKEMGISIVVLAGGEPLVRPEIFNVTKDFPDIIFTMFTNGTLIDDKVLLQFKSQKNVIPVLSIEGYEETTDLRRGKGVYEHLQRMMAKLNEKGIFFGVSMTVTRSNYVTVAGEEFIHKLRGQGCKAFFFIEYSPVRPETEHWVLTEEQRAGLLKAMASYRERLPGVYVAFPGDEKAFGGCLSAGRGFIHVSASGNLEPCPFAPFSNTSVKNMSLKEALQSDFLRTIRENHEELMESDGGCAIWKKREWVSSLLEQA